MEYTPVKRNLLNACIQALKEGYTIDASEWGIERDLDRRKFVVNEGSEKRICPFGSFLLNKTCYPGEGYDFHAEVAHYLSLDVEQTQDIEIGFIDAYSDYLDLEKQSNKWYKFGYDFYRSLAKAVPTKYSNKIKVSK